MNEPYKVTGADCLNYINRPIGFCDKSPKSNFFSDISRYALHGSVAYSGSGGDMSLDWADSVGITKFKHNINKRIVGYVTRQYSDGGYKVIILGDEYIDTDRLDYCENYEHLLFLTGKRYYRYDVEHMENVQDGSYQYYPKIQDGYEGVHSNESMSGLLVGSNWKNLIEMVEYTPDIENYGYVYTPSCLDFSQMQGSHFGNITNNQTTTLIFGSGRDNVYYRMNGEFMGDPLIYLAGDLYNLACVRNQGLVALLPRTIDNLENFSVEQGIIMLDGNNVAVPYNIVLTWRLEYAQNYLNTGTIPPDAFLFPLDWEDLPRYNEDDRPDDDTDDGDDPDNHPGFEGDPDPAEVPSFTPAKLSNNNYYWLSASQLESFINWFWNDIGTISDFNDLIDKITGLYNDLASTVLMIRYMPVDIAWLGGAGTPSNIITGMIEKSGEVPTIAKASAPIVDVGHITVPKEYKSFASYSPYSDCMLYLPYYGFMDIDMDMFTGHDIYVKAIYDHLTGTIQYLIYYENKYLVNSVVCKMAVDIPITLQSKNDRDSAIFSNVSNAVAGLIGAGASLSTGNPLGLVLGANVLNSGIHSAPLSVKGTVGESGAFYAPSKCKLITKFPVEQKASKFGQFVGKQLNKTMSLNNKDLYGFTTCYNPRITFNNSTPLQEEIDMIYDYLEKGVIL